jgi:hypothetical protein
MIKMKLLLIAGAVAMCASAMCASTAAFAQSQPNCGPNAPSGDTFGVPTSGSAQARAGARRCEAMLGHYGHHRWRHHRY